MGLFTEKFGAAAGLEQKADKISQPQAQFPTCKHCGGDLVSVRKNFDPSTRKSDFCVSCSVCGKTQWQNLSIYVMIVYVGDYIK